jgi:hypothetical protein
MLRWFLSLTGVEKALVVLFFGACITLAAAAAPGARWPRDPKEIDSYPADPNKDAIPEPPNSIQVDVPSHTQGNH